jgi:MerR family transcriptional regulator/heat shock protein HspR
MISVISRLTGVGAHTLRLHERVGLITPARTEGGSRRYSDRDLERLQRIVALPQDGLNLAGVKRVLELEEATRRLRERLARAQPQHQADRN